MTCKEKEVGPNQMEGLNELGGLVFDVVRAAVRTPH